MEPKFEIIFLESAREFLLKIEEKAREKLIYTIDKSKLYNDPKEFKKLYDSIWEFRAEYHGIQLRLLAFWDKRDKKNTLVICSHGFIKKRDKVPNQEIQRAIAIMKLYFYQK